MRGLFVSGTDTGAGKSMVAASICAALAADGERVAAFKPVVTGLAEPVGEFPPDHELLAEAAGSGQSPAEVAPYRYDPPFSPHYAAELAGETIEPARLVEAARAAAPADGLLVAEGVGGLLVPLTLGYLVRDANRAFQRLLEKRISPHGVTRGQWYFLRVLWEEDVLSQR